MAVRVTSTSLYVLHVGLSPADLFTASSYQHDYDPYIHEGTLGQGAWHQHGAVEQTATLLDAGYDLAGFFVEQGGFSSTTYGVNVYRELEADASSGVYSIDVWRQLDGETRAGYRLQAFVEHLGAHSSSAYQLDAYSAQEQVFNSQHGLDLYLMAQAYQHGTYDVSTYVDLLSSYVGSYQLQTFGAESITLAQSQYQLLAWESRESLTHSAYALNVYAESTGHLNSAHRINAWRALQARLGSQYDISTLQAVAGLIGGSYRIATLRSLQTALGDRYALNVYAWFDHFSTHAGSLLAYAPTTGQLDSQHGIAVFTPHTGSASATHAIAALQALLQSFHSSYLLDATEQFYTWVINHETGAPARYENYPFSSFARLGGQYLASGEDGIYLLDGDDDDGAPIDALATTGAIDFGASNLKRVLGAYLGMSSSGQLHLTLTTDQGQVSGPYRLRQPTVGRKTERAKLARGLTARHFQFELANHAGEEQVIDSVDLDIEQLLRRLRR